MAAKKTLNPVIAQSISDNASDLKKLALDIHATPETGFNEHLACRLQVELLKSWGFRVKTPYAGMDTSFRAEFGRGKPAVCLLSEYDALPQIGHGCGHNLICAASMGAAKSLAETVSAEKLKGKVVIMGTPAEESVGGKVIMADRGAFAGVDMSIMAHPSQNTQPWSGATAVTSYVVEFKGQNAHAAANPQAGRNALDAVRLMFNGVDAWRQQLTENARIHGIITDGGVAPNIIPDRSSCFFFLRSTEDKYLEFMVKRFHDIARGAALMTGTKVAIRHEGMTYKGPWINDTLNQAYFDYASSLGMKPRPATRSGRGSTDFCNVSQIVPGAHVYFGISSKNIPCHSVQFTAASATAMAIKSMLKAAEAMANIGRDFLTDTEFAKSVTEEFHRKAKSRAKATK